MHGHWTYNVLCESCSLQFKPRVGSVDSGVAHAWSSVVSHRIKPELGKARQPSKELRIRGLHKTEELLRCSVLASSSVTNEKDAWLCVESSAIEVGRTSQLDPIKDWRLTISAPLELVNFLPVSCKYTVSEKADGRNLVPVQSGSVEPGGSTSIFQCDLRKAIYLKWVPDGGWLPQQVRILLSDNWFVDSPIQYSLLDMLLALRGSNSLVVVY